MKTVPFLLLALFCAGLSVHARETRPETRPLVICRAELDRAVLPANQSQTAVVKITLDTAPLPREGKRPPVNLSIVLDRSGSMSGEPIEHARQAAIEAVNRLDEGDIFSLVTYDSVVETLIPAGPLLDKEEARKVIRNITPRGMTALFGGVSQGAAELRKQIEEGGNTHVHRMILLSDGLANVGPSSPADLGRLGKSLAKEGISVSTIGLGSSYGEELMTLLARQSDGNTYYVQNSRDLTRIFNEELGDVLSVAARGIFVRVVCPEGVRPVRTIGREATIRGQTVEMRLNQLYGGQERYLLLELALPAAKPESELALLTATVEYESLVENRQESQTASLTARFSGDQQKVAQSINTVVFNSVFLNYSADAKLQAVEAYDRGDRDEAVRVLEVNRRQLEAAAADFDLPELEFEARNVRGQADSIRQMGMPSESRKVLYTEGMQEQLQQRVLHRGSPDSE
ncbi:MAG: VWA domain-containing protein [Kiritimatiellae bacterium]|nr:VWA domain-containing protein [Kiritimatiellia bacterium]